MSALITFDQAVATLVANGADPVGRNGSRSFRCPLHDDGHASASIRRQVHDPDGFIAHCMVCGDQGAWFREFLKWLRNPAPLPPAAGGRRSGRGGGSGHGVPVAVYEYISATTGKAYYKTRYESVSGSGKVAKTFGWKRQYAEGILADGLNGHPQHDFLPYGSESLALFPAGPVLWCEGEKATEQAHADGLAAVCSPGGSAIEAIPKALAALAGRDVIVISDRDAVGAKYAAEVASRLAPVARSVVVRMTPVNEQGADWVEHSAAGLGLADLVEVPGLSFDPGGEPEPLPIGNTSSRPLSWLPASTIEPEPVEWLWDGRIAEGTLSLLAGREGQGKSTAAYGLIAAITKGTLPGSRYGRPSKVIVCATEDAWAQVIVPRLMAAGADLDLVGPVVVEAAPGESELSLPDDIAALGELAVELDAALLLLDPLMSRLSGSLDTHKDAEVRQALEPLTKMLADTGMAAVGLIHLNKVQTSDPLNALMGSRAFAAVARSVNLVMADPDDDEGRRKFLALVKNNLGPTNLPIEGFTIVGESILTRKGAMIATSRVEWTGTVAGLSVAEVMEAANAGFGDRTQVAEASDWLTDYLISNGGQAESLAAKKAGKAMGFTDRTLQRALRKIGGHTSSHGFPRTTIWHLPEERPPAPSRYEADASRAWGHDATVATVATGSAEHDIAASRAGGDMMLSQLVVGGTTGGTTPSRDSRDSQERPPARDVTGDVTTVQGLSALLLNACSGCGRQTVSNPCTECRRSA